MPFWDNWLPPNIRLLKAAKNGEAALVRRLIEEFGADVNMMNRMGQSVLQIAYKKGHLETSALLLKLGATFDVQFGQAMLMKECERGQTDLVEILLSRDVSPDASATSGASALMFASTSGHIDIVRLLSEKGANLNAITANGVTALMVAAGRGNNALVNLLISKGARKDLTNEHRETAEDVARRKGHAETAALLSSN